VQGYDIIGDVHGCANELEALLGDLGYRPDDRTGVYCHPDRRAVFVGDLVDRGPNQLRALDIVKCMVDSGSAQVVMGNHEFNAIAYSIEHPAGSDEFLRPHSDKNRAQHEAFLEQVTGEKRTYYLDWFKTLPLWLDLGELRIIHACWHEKSMKVVERELGSDRFNAIDQFVRASAKGHPLYHAIEVLLKGPEISLVDHGKPPYRDNDGHRRTKARVRWWNEGGTTLREIAEMGGNVSTEDGAPYPPLPDLHVPAGERSYVYTGDVPVFYGHYWRQGVPKHLLDWTAHTACVDFSAVDGGTLTAYRWSGETHIQLEHYVPHTGVRR
jgi:Calcineurin-like phosphoesterase